MQRSPFYSKISARTAGGLRSGLRPPDAIRRGTRRSQRGQAIVLITFASFMLFGLMGLVVDFGIAYFHQRAAQAAADAAAMAAATAAKSSGTYTAQSSSACPSSPSTTRPLDIGCLYATQNGYTNGSNHQTVAMAGGTSALSSVNSLNYWTQATITETLYSTFFAVLGHPTTTISANGTAGVVVEAGTCIYVLDPNGTKALQDTGGSATMGCGIKVDSSDPGAFNTTAHNALTLNNGASISVNGGWNDSTSGGCCTFNGGGSVKTNQGSFSNPVSGLPTPTVTTPCTADPSVSGTHAPLNPGTYCAISVSNTGPGSLVMNAGTYVMYSGDFKQSGGTITASGVTLYFPSTGGRLDLTGGNMTLTAPANGATMGIPSVAVWQTTSSQSAITGGADSISGLIYMPNALLDITGGFSSAAATIVVKDLTITGGSVSGGYNSPYVSGSPSMNGIFLLPN